MKKAIAKELGETFKSRSQLAREIIDFIAALLADRHIILSADGGYSTKEFLRQRVDNVDVTGRFPVSSQLYQLPDPKPEGKRGPKPKKGALIGSPKTLATKEDGWIAHPTESNTCPGRPGLARHLA